MRDIYRKYIIMRVDHEPALYFCHDVHGRLAATADADKAERMTLIDALQEVDAIRAHLSGVWSLRLKAEEDGGDE